MAKETSNLYDEVIFFTEKNILEVPNVAGVFQLYDKKGDLIYIGSSNRLQHELLKILRSYNPCFSDTKYYKVEINPDYKLGELKAFRAFKAKNRGKIPKCNDRDPTQLIRH